MTVSANSDLLRRVKQFIAILSVCAFLALPVARVSAAGPVEAQPFSSQEVAELQAEEEASGEEVGEMQAGNLGGLLYLAALAAAIYLGYEALSDD